MTESSGISKVTPSITTEEYAEIQSFDDAFMLINSKLGGVVVDAADLGDGFSVLTKDDKVQLIGVPFIILSYRQSMGDEGMFSSIRLVTKDGRKLVLNDGSTGIHEQLTMMLKMRPETAGKPIMCSNGLRVSEYDYTNANGTVSRARTYYLNTSATK